MCFLVSRLRAEPVCVVFKSILLGTSAHTDAHLPHLTSLRHHLLIDEYGQHPCAVLQLVCDGCKYNGCT